MTEGKKTRERREQEEGEGESVTGTVAGADAGEEGDDTDVTMLSASVAVESVATKEIEQSTSGVATDDRDVGEGFDSDSPEDE